MATKEIETLSEKIVIRVKPSEKKRLRAEAKKNGKRPTDYIREWLGLTK